MNPPWSDSPPFPSFENLVKRRRRRRFLLSRWFIELSRRRLHFLSFVSFPPPPFYAFSLFLFLYSLVFRSSFSLVSLGSWLDDEPTRRERERENGHLVSLYKYQVLFSLSLSLSCERSLTFFFPYSPSEIVTKRRWENPSSNKFLLHILYIIEED